MQKILIKKRRNFRKLFLGALFLAIAGSIFRYAFDSWKENPQPAGQNQSVQQQITLSQGQTAAPAEKILPEERQPPNSISLKSLLSHAEIVYDPKEKSRREGILWIDRSASRYVVTLGAINGLKPQDRLWVYEGSKQVGEVAVETTFDVISYVHPIGDTAPKLKNNYYKIFVP